MSVPKADVGSGEDTVETILLVDDEQVMRTSIGEMLRRSGYEVVAAGDGDSALSALAESIPIDLVIADYRMPGMDGIQLMRRIKEMHPSLPVVMMTGQGDLESYLHAVGLGVSRYLGKPFGLRDLLRTVQEAVAGGLSRRTLHQL